MNRYWLFLLTLGLMVGCQEFPCTDQVCPDYTLEYVKSGGFGGVYHQLVLNEDGTVEARNKVYMVTAAITSEEREVWRERLNQVNFFNLDDDYLPEEPIADGFGYQLIVESEDQAKSVSVADGGAPPEDLFVLLGALYSDLYLPVYRDSATLGTVFSTKYQVRPWPFTAVAALREQGLAESFYFDEIDSTGEIEDYLRALYSPDGDYVSDPYHLHQEDDSLYTLKLQANGFFIKSVHPIRYWPADLNIPLSDIIDEGVIVQAEVYQEVKALLIEPLFVNSIFIEAPANEYVVAYYVTLRNGMYVGQP